MTAPNASSDHASSEVIDALNALLTGSHDGSKVARDAAEAVHRADLKSLLTEQADQSERHARELDAEVRRLGGEPDDGGKLGAKARRVVTDLVAAVTGRDDTAVLSQVEGGLDQAERAYALAQREALGAQTRTLVQRQWDEVAANHNRIADLLRQDPGKAQAKS